MPRKGFKQSEEHRQKIAASLAGRKRSAEECASISAGRKGASLSPEHRARIAEAISGRKKNPEEYAVAKSDISKHLVYMLSYTTSDRIYIGKSSIGLERPRNHLLPSQRRGKEHYPLYQWIAAHHKHGDGDPAISVLEQCDSEDAVLAAEIRWIAGAREAEFNLLNCTDGGEGVSGYKHTPEEVERIREMKSSLESIAVLVKNNKSRVWSDEARAVLAAAAGTPSALDRLAAARAAFEASPDHAARMAAMRQKAQSPEALAKMAATKQVQWADPEQASKWSRACSTGMKKKWEDPEFAEKAKERQAKAAGVRRAALRTILEKQASEAGPLADLAREELELVSRLEQAATSGDSEDIKTARKNLATLRIRRRRLLARSPRDQERAARCEAVVQEPRRAQLV
jgi:hypothetical protein